MWCIRSLDDFKKWTVVQLREFLGDCDINKDGVKEKLVANAYGAYELDIQAKNIDAQTEDFQVKDDYEKKLVLEDGMINLPELG